MFIKSAYICYVSFKSMAIIDDNDNLEVVKIFAIFPGSRPLLNY